MKKIIRPFSKRKLKNRFYQYSRSLGFQVLCCGIILIAGFQLPALAVLEDPNDIRFDSKNVEPQTAEQDIRELKPGETVERQAKANDIHPYQITLEAGTSFEINVGKRDAFFEILAIIPDSNAHSNSWKEIPPEMELGRVAAGAGDVLVEPLVVVAEKTGKYIILARFPTAGIYSFSCSIPRLTTERDRKSAAAGKLLSEMRRAFEKGEPRWKMRDKAEERASIYRSLNDKKSLALSLNDVGFAYSSNAEWKKAAKYFNEALELFRSLNSVPNIIDNLILVARAASETGDYQNAIDKFNEVLTISRSIKDSKFEGIALHSLGVAYHLLADEQKARNYYEQSLSVVRSIIPPTTDSLSGEGVTLTNIGNLYRGVGGGEIPIDSFSPRTTSDRQKALEYYQRALEVARKSRKLFPNALTLEAFNLQQIGNTYKELGNYSEALNYLNQSLERYRIISKPGQTIGNSKRGQTNVLVSIGNLYVVKGEYQKGFEYFEQVLTLLKEDSVQVNQIGYLNIIAKDYYRAGETQRALELYNESFELSRARGQHDKSATALFEIAQIERDLGNFNNARNRIEEAIHTVESVRARITSQELRTTYFSTVKRYYDFYIDLLMQANKSQPEKGFDALALQISDKARSRSLLDLLTLARIDIKQGVDPALLESEQQAREKLIEKANQQSRLLLGKHTKEEAEKIKTEVSNLTDQYQAIQVEIRNKSPRYAALTQPTSLNAKQIQQLLDSGTILLEYALGEKKSYLWAVTNDSIAGFDLPKREEIETQARKVYELLTARNQNLKNETDKQRLARIKAAEEEYPKAAAELSRMLLAPVASQIGNKRLLIVPDGTLNYIPFSALPSPKDIDSVNLWQPLGIGHEIVTLPSASILALLREETQSRKPAPKMLVVFADPVFSETDTRANSAIAARTKGNAKQKNVALRSHTEIEKTSFNRDFERAVADVGLRSGESGGLPRLPFSRREADSIFKVAPKNLSLKEVDFDASKAAVFSSNLEQYRILHFATHGLLNSQHPELSGIVLSLVDKKGGDIDGFLRLQDIYNLKLSADLVVLSACNTALGKDVKGEGLIGMTRGFMYAGAPRVVASLWKVDDAATAEFMSIFYKKILVENLRPAAALRAAQTEMMKQTRWKSPYYWAPFIIQGEWR